MTQTDRNNRYRTGKGLVPVTLLLRPESKATFSDIRQRNHITVADLFDELLKAYQTEQTGQRPTAGILGELPAFQIGMPDDEARGYAAALVQVHGDQARKELIRIVKGLFPVWSCDNKRGMAAAPEVHRTFRKLTHQIDKLLKGDKTAF